MQNIVAENQNPQTASGSLREKSDFRRVMAYLGPHRRQFFLALLCMVAFGASEGAVPFFIKYILDGVFAEQNKQLLYWLPIILICFALLRAGVDFGQQFLMARVGHRVVRDIRTALNDHLLSLSPGFFIKNSSANLLSRVTSDVILVRTLLTDTFSALIKDLIRVIALLSAAIYLDPVLAAIAFVALPIGIYPIIRFGKRMRKLSKKGQDVIGSLSSMMQESILGNKVVKIFGREAFERERFRLENQSLTDTFVKSEKVRALTGPVNEVLAMFAVSGVVLYGGYSVIGGTRSQGDFIAFLASVFLMYDPFKKLSRVHNTIQQGLSGAERIFEVLDSAPEVTSPLQPRLLGQRNDIEFENVEFSYEQSGSSALRNISLLVPEGKKVALVGFSGAGKSTLVDLIPRFMDPVKGQVKIGGVDISQVDLVELRSRIAMVDQHTFLFQDTIRQNIAYGNPLASEEQIVEAAKAAHAYDFIQQLPQGFDTKVGQSGLSLSGGERQRISIARAILKDAPILILDEATASLDNRSEREVQAALERLERGKTSVIIAHRLSTVRNADLIVVLRDGEIVEMGEHDQLLSQQGEFARLYALQFENQKVDDESTNTDDEVLLN